MQTEVVFAAILAPISLAAAFAVIRRRLRGAARQDVTTSPQGDESCCVEDAAEQDGVPDLKELLSDTLRRDLSLAAEHVHSIRWLLEISRQHQQPIPTSALTNLALVSKHLGEIQRRIETAGDEGTLEPDITAPEPLRQDQAPPHRQPSFECRASPSGKSTPYD